MNNKEKLKTFDAEVDRITASIKVLEGERSEIWQKRDALFNACQ
jgi:hypothetical protein